MESKEVMRSLPWMWWEDQGRGPWRRSGPERGQYGPHQFQYRTQIVDVVHYERWSPRLVTFHDGSCSLSSRGVPQEPPSSSAARAVGLTPSSAPMTFWRWVFFSRSACARACISRAN